MLNCCSIPIYGLISYLKSVSGSGLNNLPASISTVGISSCARLPLDKHGRIFSVPLEAEKCEIAVSYLYLWKMHEHIFCLIMESETLEFHLFSQIW